MSEGVAEDMVEGMTEGLEECMEFPKEKGEDYNNTRRTHTSTGSMNTNDLTHHKERMQSIYELVETASVEKCPEKDEEYTLRLRD
ncbi:hypothetical protein JG687_00010474 [Phytophthora cactorum]|uniref:Uncharacterized protein n=2 Tax=Phytophthora cactorum TaxID=29920 RepID=A0A8T1U8C7_9STRA|nr:hypothetical protein JG687_00010474 [Phytophthora cactorum]